MNEITRIGVDTSKHVFHLHGVDANDAPILRKKLRRNELMAFFGALPPALIAMEACAGSHHWARLLQALGHEVKLIPPQYVKAYLKRGKNDAADAEAICEAASRPTMRFVPIKTADNQAALMMLGMRDRLIKNRTRLANAIRAYAAELGVIAAQGMAKIESLLDRIAADTSIPSLARDLFALHAREFAQLRAEIEAVEDKLMEWHRSDERSQRLAKIPGVGPIGATLLALKTPTPDAFRSGRHFAAWLGLTPKDHSTGGKTRLGCITRAGDELLRSVLVAGATVVLRHVRSGRRGATLWMTGMLERKPPKLVAVALANKIARIAWKLMVSGETYRAEGSARPLALAA